MEEPSSKMESLRFEKVKVNWGLSKRDRGIKRPTFKERWKWKFWDGSREIIDERDYVW